MACPYCGATFFVQTPDNGDDFDDSVETRCKSCSNTFFPSIASVPVAAQPASIERKEVASGFFDEGLRLMEEKQYASAVTKLRAASAIEPERVDMLMALGEACSRGRQSYEALAAYMKVLESNSENSDALFKAGALLIHQKRYKKGQELLRRLQNIDPAADHARLMLAIAEAQLSKEKSNATPSIGSARVPGDLTASERFSELFGMIGKARKSTWAFLLIWILPPFVFAEVYSSDAIKPEILNILLITMLVYTLFFSVVVHELGHGVAAFLSGDDTAYRAGRLTLNPINHVSLVGTFAVPVVMYMISGVTFGWAKPVPFNPLKLHRQPRDQALVAAAGPMVSFLLSYLMFTAFLVLAATHNSMHPESTIRFTTYLIYPFEVGEGVFSAMWFVALELLAIGAVVNLYLAVFNLIPAPPLDGAWLLKAAAPPSWSIVIDRGGWVSLLLILAAIYTGWIVYLFYPANLIIGVYYFLSDVIL
ncbi:FIG004556: membrane metalloprotease [hydrothermal vent metagenome]|uniref:FIG004556: membrane metalloprotease n=1 Tax=hydrothermal vent metagenome TaxID=652676 RepID=A0A3B1BT41_9ZZZZ